MTLGDISYDFGIGGKMAALSEKYTHILLVVQTLNMFYLMPWISSLSKDANVTIINLGAGVSSYIHSTQPEMADVALLMPYMAVQEVYDKQTLDAALIAPGKNYIRVPHGETHTTLFPTAIDVEKGIGDVRPHGFEGISGTLIAPGGVLVSAIHALQDLQNE